jgi:hypothetical protein
MHGAMPVWRLTVRDGSRVERFRHETLDEALADLRSRVKQLEPRARRDEVTFLRRKIEPVSQVAARIEVAGPQRFVPAVQGGLDLRGDGSSEAYTGRLRRRLIEPKKGENALAALTRTLRAQASA